MAKIMIRANPDNTLVDVPDDFVGINVNYLVDHDSNRPPGARPLASALDELGVRMLRFPGGEKSDFHLWSQPPWDKSDPQVNAVDHRPYGQTAAEHTLFDFDAFMALVRETGTVPYLVTAYDNVERTGMTEEQFLQNAVEWVRYANVKRGYGVRYWEVGNENWHNETGRPEDVARIVARFSKAMKEVDPGILIGASGCSMEWWEGFLPLAAPHIDFLTVSNYSTGCCRCFEDYRRTDGVKLDGIAAAAPEAIELYAPEADRDRLFIISAEANSMDFSPEDERWPGHNTLGHALVTIDLFGQLLLVPRLRHALLWNTRWLKWRQPDSIWYALDPANSILPSGRAVAIWGNFLRDRLVQVSQAEGIVAYASATDDGSELNVFLIHKADRAQTIDVAIAGGGAYREAVAFRFSGTGSEDMAPVWQELGSIPVQSDRIADLQLPDTSFTLISLKR